MEYAVGKIESILAIGRIISTPDDRFVTHMNLIPIINALRQGVSV
jgi:hypothetical protein